MLGSGDEAVVLSAREGFGLGLGFLIACACSPECRPTVLLGVQVGCSDNPRRIFVQAVRFLRDVPGRESKEMLGGKENTKGADEWTVEIELDAFVRVLSGSDEGEACGLEVPEESLGGMLFR